jgi:hypothetical protein
MVQHRVLEAAPVVRVSKRQEGRLAAGELEHRRSLHGAEFRAWLSMMSMSTTVYRTACSWLQLQDHR